MPRIGVKLEGVAEHVNALNRAIRDQGIATQAGLIKAGLFVQRESQKQVPVDKGNLKGSAYTDYRESPGKKIVEIGYGAVYAVRQHEEVTWSHKVGKAKFLEDPIKENTKTILEIIKNG